MRKLSASLIMLVALSGVSQAQNAAPLPPPGQDTAAGGLPVEYLPSLPVPKTGQAPTMRVTELNPANKRSFQVVFSRGDEPIQGLAEFAAKNNINIAHFTAFGALTDASLAWFEADKRIYKTIRLHEPMEVTSFTGSIVRNATTGGYTVHVHGSVAQYRTGNVYAGHFIDAKIGPTMQVYIDDATALNPPAPAATAAARPPAN